MVLVIVSFPQIFPPIIEIEYTPAAVNDIPKLSEPHVKGLLLGVGLPREPL